MAVRGVCRRRLAAELNHHELVMVTRRRPEPEARHSLPLRAWITAAVNVFWVCRVCVVRCCYILDPEILVGSSGLGSRDDDLILLPVTDRPYPSLVGGQAELARDPGGEKLCRGQLKIRSGRIGAPRSGGMGFQDLPPPL